ncbi:MAG: class I SAM-dependent methyltransferase [Oscillospiraceae bacterium]|nr:class I SAM-dependent methyltransferase [Oscillospiraceae bacterium]
MLNQKGFDLWADGYDKSVGLSDEENSYPFAGYKRLLGRIYEIVRQKGTPTVLDLGFGTGVLTARLYEAGCRVYGQDFSQRMIELAREKMPGATLVRGDFSRGLAPALAERRYDCIIATYALHHLRPEEKPPLLRLLLDRLNPGGELLIGDVAFMDQAAQESCRRAAGEEWDEEEFYFVFEEMKAEFPAMAFEQISDCAGLLRMKKQ